MEYIVLDMEWNQPRSRKELIINPVRLVGEIIQIGAIKLDSDFKAVDNTDIMVLPKFYTEMNQCVERLTGIDEEDLVGQKHFPEAYREFREWCGDDCAIITWGPDDISILRSNIIIHGLDESTIPVHYNLQLIFNKQVSGDNRQWALSAAMEKLGIPVDLPCHNALNDAVYTARICNKLDMKKGIAEYSEPAPKEKKPKRDRYFNIRNDLISAEEVTGGNHELLCPECSKKMSPDEKIVKYKNGDKLLSVSCPEHGKYLVVFKRLGGYDGEIDYEKRIYHMNDHTMGFYRHTSYQIIKSKRKYIKYLHHNKK